MKRTVRVFPLFSAMLLVLSVQAQPDERKWAVGYSSNVLLYPVSAGNSANISNGSSLGSFSVMGEYCFSDKWSAEFGYFHTDMGYKYHGRTLEGLQCGVKRYLLDEHLFFQPYVSARGQMNWSKRFEYYDANVGGDFVSYRSRNPLLSFAPGLGLELYLFSSLSFTVRYDFIMGIDSWTTLDGHYQNNIPFHHRDNGMYHNLELGTKITFPFRFTKRDEWLLLDLLFSILD